MAKLQHNLACRVFAKSYSDPIFLPSTKIILKTPQNAVVTLLKTKQLKRCLYILLGTWTILI